MRKKILVGAVFVAVVTIAFLCWQLRYPDGWDRIQLGMPRQEVYALTGPPTVDTADIKGAFWYQQKTILFLELQVYFEADKVAGFYVTQYIGTDQHFVYKRMLRDSLAQTDAPSGL